MIPRKIEISHRTIIFTVFFLIFLKFLQQIGDILLQLFVAAIIMLILNPTVRKLQRFRIPRVASILIVYIAAIGLVVISIANVIPLLVDQSTNLAQALPVYLQELNIPVSVIDTVTNELSGQIANLPSQVFKISIAVVSNTISVIAVLLFALYFLLMRQNLDQMLSRFLKKTYVEHIDVVLDKLEKKLGGWARGQILLMVLVGLATYIGLLILGIPFAIPLALLAGLFEAIPNIGPVVAAVPVVVVGFGVSPVAGFATLALTFLIQQLEAYFIVPKVMQKSAGIHPLVTLVSLVIGFRLAGIVGAILSLPVVLTLAVLTEEFVNFKNNGYKL